jgi:hypothetical protein
MTSIEIMVTKIQASLDDSLRRAPWKGSDNALAGHCYVASEALFHLLPGMKPQFIRHEGAPHWFLLDPDGNAVDATAGQFKTPVPYENAKGKGFLTKNPSKRAQILISKVS